MENRERASLYDVNRLNFAELFLDPQLNCPAPTRDLVARKGGRDLMLVITKKLTVTDLDPRAGRLSIPVSQVKDQSFLTEEEKEILSKGGAIEVTLIQPCLEEISLQLRRWTFTSRFSYVLNSGWDSVITNEENPLEVSDIVQLWSFRRDNNLFFVIV